MSIASDLTVVATNLNSALGEINTKIEAKGGTASETVYGVAAAVENLPSGGETTSPNIIKTRTSSLSPIQLTNGSWFLPNYSSYDLGKLRSSATTDISINPSQSQIRYVVKFKQASNFTIPEWKRIIGGDKTNSSFPHLGIDTTSGKIFSQLMTPTSELKKVYADYVIEMNTWYYACLYYFAENIFCSLYDENGTLLASGGLPYATPISEANKILLGGTGTNWGLLENSEIDLSETLVELNGTIIWGKTNSKTKNMRIYDITDFSEFTQVEYIESTGTQFIQTDTVVYSTDKVEAEVVFVDKSLTTFAWCAREALNSKFFNALNLTGEFRFDYFDEQFTGPSVINNQKYKITMDGNKLYLDDTLIKTFAQVNSNSVNPACLMASYNPYKTYGNIGKMKHFGFRVWDNSSIIKANFVPCYHTATGVIGMFDTVNNKFYMNAGTGTFLKGADVNG